MKKTEITRKSGEMGRYKKSRAMLLYTVYNNRDDMPVIVDGTAREAAKAMGVTLKTFYSAITNEKTGRIRKWHFEKITRRQWLKEMEEMH